MNRITTLLLTLVAIAVQATSASASGPAYAYSPVIGALKMALDASYIDTSDTNEVVVRNGVTYVKSWLDFSGNGNVAAQTLPSLQPVYVPNAANGLPVVQFDGLSAFMTTTLAQIKGNKSIFIVEKRTINSLSTEISSTTGTSGMYLGNSYGGGYETEGRLNIAQDLQVAAPSNHFILKSFILSGSTGTLRVNGSLVSAKIIDSASGNYQLSYPGYLRFGGQIAEILIYNNAMTDLQRQAIESYLNDKWGLQDTPPPVVSGLQLRLAANTIDTSNSNQVVQQNGVAYIQSWPDTSGSGVQVTQSNAADQPILVPGALNGEPVVQFDGKADYLNTTLNQITGDKSIFVVQRRVGTGLKTEIASSTLASGMFLGNLSKSPVESAGRLGVAQDVQLPGYLNGFILKSFIRSGSQETLMVNDSSATAQVPDAASGVYTISASSGYQFSGQIAEVLIYNRAVTEPERQSIENYLSQKYGLWNFSRPDQSGLQMWMSSDAIESGTFYQSPQVTISGTNAFVGTWFDRSSMGYSALQSATASQVAYAPAAFNGHPLLQFNTTKMFLPTTMPQISGDKSIFVLERRRSQTAARELSTSSTTGGHLLGSTGSSESKGNLSTPNQLQVPWQYNQLIVKSLVRSGSNETLSITGTSPASTSGTIADSAGGNYTFSDSRSPFVGDIGEALIYNRAVSGTDAVAISNYLVDKWSHYPNDLYSVSPDLQVPSDTLTTTPAAGVMVKMTVPVAPYAGTAVYNTLYLPTDWQPGQTYPVIVEYPPNGSYPDAYNGITDSRSTGQVEDCAMGYGISGGQGFIVIGMPCIGGSPLTNQTTWWGNVAATKDYCLKTIQYVCQNYGGDPSAVILAGFSRGAAACNYIGLSDSNIADTWLAFIAHSGYDYEDQYGSPWDSEETGQTAAQRFAFLNGRAQYISQGSVIDGDWEISVKYFLENNGANLSAFTFRTMPYENHSGAWALRPIQMRRDVRAWLQNILATRPGTYSISGVVTDPSGNPIAGALVQTGTTHFTYTAADGSYTLASLVNSSRTVTVTASAYTFSPQAVTVANANLINVNFQAGQ